MEEAAKTEEPSTIVNSTVESKKRFNSGPYVVGILLFLVVCLLAALTYFVLKDNGVELFSTKTENTSTTGDSSTTADSSSSTTTNTTTCSDSDKDCKVAVTNSGWALFSLPEYDFSVETPYYSMTQQLGGEDVPSFWKVGHETSNATDTTGYNNYLGTINVSFYPSYIPEGTGCGEGCVHEQEFVVTIYQNSGNKSLSDVKDLYTQKWITANQDAYDNQAENITGSISTLWNRNVYSYHIQRPGGGTNGYLVVTKDYVYDVTYFLSTTPADSYAVAQKVFDSMKFEDTSSSTDAN